MAFVKENLSYSGIGAGSSAPKLFSYNGSADTKATVIADNYFNSVYKQLAVGDTFKIPNWRKERLNHYPHMAIQT